MKVFKTKKDAAIASFFMTPVEPFCDPAGIRTQDPIIKSDVLYQLSYRVCNHFLIAGANIRRIFYYPREFWFKFAFFLQGLFKFLFIRYLLL